MVRPFGMLPRRVTNATLSAATGAEVLQIEAVSVSSGGTAEITFEDAKDGARHGVWLAVDGELKVGETVSPQITLWMDTAPRTVPIEIVTSSDQLLRLYNVWDDGRGRDSQAATSGMIRDELPGGSIRYRCMDYGAEPSFDALTFTLRILADTAA